MAPFERKAPKGTVIPRRGPYAGRICKYGGSGEYMRIAGYSVAELESFISGKKEWRIGARVDEFIISMKKHDYDYGSQMAREGYERYRELVQACLEDGEVNTKIEVCRHRAPVPIGISIFTGKAVTEYMMRADSDGRWLIEPGWVR